MSDDVVKNNINPRFGVLSNYHMAFSNSGRAAKFTVNYIDQGEDGANAWMTFVFDKSEGFTQPGVKRIKDSIRMYVWVVLGAQTQIRSSILGTGSAFDALKPDWNHSGLQQRDSHREIGAKIGHQH